jgi:alpha-tubulin suppressor-like RCC1 family protein
MENIQTYTVKVVKANSNLAMQELRMTLNSQYSQHQCWGGEHICGISDGSVSCWGRNGDNLLGDGNNSQQDFPTLTTVIQQRAIYITAGEIGICVILEDNTFTCWGR